jgi:D-xylose 1-dehydrogenase (NADP+, D-xylono-1,5-lactone-forming)
MGQRINWGIMGCAGIAERTLIPAIQGASNAMLLGIASRAPRKAKEWAARFDIPKAYAGYQALLDDPDIEAVYIPLPNDLHAEWTIRSAAAGKHILCEKPMAMRASEVLKMKRAADNAGVLLMEAFMYRFHPQIEKALRLVRSGAIGEMRTIRSAFSFPFKGGPENYRWRPESGGGALYDVGCYPISAARLFFGVEPSAVYARARFHPKYRVDMTTCLLLEFPGGSYASLECGFESQFQSALQVVGTEGRLSMDRAFSAKLLDVEIRVINEDAVKTIPVSLTNQYARMVEHFGRCIRGRKPVRYPALDAYRNMKVIDAAFESIRTGRTVRITK